MNGEEEFFDAPQTAEDLESLLITTSTYFDSNDNFLKSFEYKTTLQSLFKQISSCRIQQVMLG